MMVEFASGSSELIKKSKDLIKSRFDKFNIKVIENIDDIEILSYQNELFQVILNLFFKFN